MKTVIVTGGSRGIGKAITESLAKDGYNVFLNYNKSEEQAYEIKKDLGNMGKCIEIFKADVSNRKEVKNMVNKCIEKFQNIDILINNAGKSQIKPFADITENEWNDMINVNLNSAFHTTQEVLPNMLKNKSGCIINISSIWGMVGSSCEVHYSTSKAGIIGFTKALAKELGPSNIRVNGVAPGIIATDMNNEITDEEMNTLINDIPLKKVGMPTDIVKCVKWLIDDEFTTGQIISPNGGWII